MELEDNGEGENAVKILAKQLSIEKEEAEDISSFEATSSETDDSSKKMNIVEEFKREDDEELRPLLQTSVTSLSTTTSPLDATDIVTTEANETPTLPDTNQKSQVTTANSSNGKRKNKKKRR